MPSVIEAWARNPLVKIFLDAAILIALGFLTFLYAEVTALRTEQTKLIQWQGQQITRAETDAVSVLRRESRLLQAEVSRAATEQAISDIRARLERFDDRIERVAERIERHVDTHQRAELNGRPAETRQ